MAAMAHGRIGHMRLPHPNVSSLCHQSSRPRRIPHQPLRASRSSDDVLSERDASLDEEELWTQASKAAPGGTDSYDFPSRQQDNLNLGYSPTRPGTQPRRGRRVFTFKNWKRHRETSRYFRHVKGILTSATFTSLQAPLLFFTANATLVATYQWCIENRLLPANFPLLQIDENPITLTSFALSLLLVFRTDASYARWNECLGAWSDVRNTAKEIGRAGSIWVKKPALQQTLRRWTIAFPRCLQVYLREHGDIHAELRSVLLPHELVKLTSAHNYPHYVLHVLTEVVGRAGLSEIREDILLASIAKFSKAIGVCEKIMRYPIPLSYSRHTSRFMTIWLCLLPFSLWPGCKWAMIPITGFVSFLLLGIEEIGVQIEEPFWLMPLEDFCSDIERDMSAIMLSKDSVQELVASISDSGSSSGGSSNGWSSGSYIGNGSSNGGLGAAGALPPVALSNGRGHSVAGLAPDYTSTITSDTFASPDFSLPGAQGGGGGGVNGASRAVATALHGSSSNGAAAAAAAAAAVAVSPPASAADAAAGLVALALAATRDDKAKTRLDLTRASLDFDD